MDRPPTGTTATADGRAPAIPGLVVALDGPSSSGKSTVGAEAARRLRYRFCDTGLLYRALTWLAIEDAVEPGDADALLGRIPAIELVPDRRGRLRHVLVHGRDVTHEVRAPAVDARVSEVAKIPAVRAALMPRQRALVEGGGIIMAGRDIGTVVLPDADLKIYLDASPEERARRRSHQRGIDHGGDEATRILDDIRRRDSIDSTRATAPLRAAPDAVVLRTDGNRFDDTVREVVGAIRAAEDARRQQEATGA